MIKNLFGSFILQGNYSNMRHTILVADDSMSVRMYMRSVLEKEGYSVLEAVNGNDALGKTETHRPDLLLLDLLMPQMDGFEVLAQLKNRSITLPIIVITADIQDGVKDECIGLGALTVINKPVDFSKLLHVISQILKPV